MTHRLRSAHGQVLEQWPRMFQILSLFCERFSDCVMKLAYPSESVASRETPDDDSASAPPVESEGQRLVRIPIEDLDVQHTPSDV